MQARILKWGNSSGIRLPINLLKSLNLRPNDKVEMVQEGEKIVISKSKELSLEEKFKNYKGPNLAKEFEWDDARGKEIW